MNKIKLKVTVVLLLVLLILCLYQIYTKLIVKPIPVPYNRDIHSNTVIDFPDELLTISPLDNETTIENINTLNNQ